MEREKFIKRYGVKGNVPLCVYSISALTLIPLSVLKEKKGNDLDLEGVYAFVNKYDIERSEKGECKNNFHFIAGDMFSELIN